MGKATTITNCTVAGDIYVVYNEVEPVGGVIGKLGAGAKHESELHNALKSSELTVQTTGLPEGDTCGKYCGSPKVDSLD